MYVHDCDCHEMHGACNTHPRDTNPTTTLQCTVEVHLASSTTYVPTLRTTRPSGPLPSGKAGNHAVLNEKLNTVLPLTCEMRAAPVGIGSRLVTLTLY